MSKEPWESYPEVWPTKSSFFSWLRGGLRRAIWEKYPGKILFKKSKLTKPPEGYTGKAKSGAECALTGVWTGNSKLQVDHIKGESSLKDWKDVEPFIRHLCTNDANMQLVETEAHKVKTYAERNNLTFEQALIEKQVIQFKKLSADKQKILLTKYYDQANIGTTISKRVEQYREVIKNAF